MIIDLDILAYSFEAATRNEPDFAEKFYREFLARNPQCQRIFEISITKPRERMLARAIVAVLAHLDDPGWLRENMPALGRQHELLGVEPPMYASFARCLVDCLEQSAGSQWPNGARQHWAAALEIVTDLMCEPRVEGA